MIFIKRNKLLVVSVIIFLFGCAPEPPGEKLNRSATVSYGHSSFVSTLLHELKISYYEIRTGFQNSGSYPMGGALAVINENQLLLVDGAGAFYFLDHDGVGLNSIRLKNLIAPINIASYLEDIRLPSRNFRVTDMLLERTEDENKRTIFIANHRWEEEKCISLSVYEGEIYLDSLDTQINWKKRFTSTPCMSGEGLRNETGGRLAVLSPSELILTVGVTFTREEYWDIAADDTSSYGKIIEIDRNTWRSKILTKGHRNPQGLLVDEGRVWSTEHGPSGGDELNLIVSGNDYGWPTSSYGVDYSVFDLGARSAKGSNTPGQHSYGTLPILSWVPSIGISNLLKVKGAAFPLWREDFLIGSLTGDGKTGKALFRVRLHDDVVKVVEKIDIGVRVRDLVELPGGDIVIWDGAWIVQVITPASPVFSKCITCHSIVEGWPSGMSPNLFGVFNRKIGSLDDYEYSSAMQEAGGTWTRKRLDEFLRDPQALVPGTSMDIVGIEDDDMRQEIIDRLEYQLH